jgi:sterol 3beta-glucosyltransferase
MKVTLSTHGTRGDVQPFVALALALMARGHDVVLAAPVNLVAFVERCGVQATKLAVDSQAFMESPAGRRWLGAGNARVFMKELGAVIHAHRDELIEDTERACSGADVIVAGLLSEDYCAVVAEARRLPLLTVHFAPMRPNSDYSNALVSARHLPKPLNRATHALAEMAWWNGYRDDVNEYRRRLGLPPARTPTRRRLPALGARTLHAFSPAIVPPPADYADMPLVGAIRLPASARARLGEQQPDGELVAWLADGPPPVFFGMGSMPVEHPDAMLRVITETARRLDIRALVGAGWSRLADADADTHVRIVGAVDHGWLLPRCQAAVHHGGAGTTHAVLAAGLPAVIASVFADQPFWGTRLERLGVGVHVPFARLTAARLEAALRRVLAPPMRDAARRLGATVAAEPDATPAIVAAIETLARQST